MISQQTCSCRTVCYFVTLFWDDITKFWDENLLLFTFSTGKLRKNLFWTNKKFVYLNIITNFHPKITYKNIVPMTWKRFSVCKFLQIICLQSWYFSNRRSELIIFKRKNISNLFMVFQIIFHNFFSKHCALFPFSWSLKNKSITQGFFHSKVRKLYIQTKYSILNYKTCYLQ